MSDLINRLRNDRDDGARDEAADEIEQLRQQVASLTAERDEAIKHLRRVEANPEDSAYWLHSLTEFLKGKS